MEEKNCKKGITNLTVKLNHLIPELKNPSSMLVEISDSISKTIEIGNNNNCFSETLKVKLSKLIPLLNKISIKEEEDINVHRSINLINEILEELE
ncbi:MAG: hypothetical protein WCP69_03280 [Bacteroidota bacterium]